MNPTLYEKVGGAELVARLIPEFYRRVLGDPLLAPFFENSDVDRIVRMQQEFFSIALDGPPSEYDYDLRRIHANRGIQTKHLSRYTDHLLAVLMEIGIDNEDANHVVSRIAMYSNEILDEAGGIDG